MNYRAEIDGLRAIAVILVVLFHLGLTRFGQGGFIGVDVFFVISGYLITGHLRRDMHKGWTAIGDFYHRRALRIFPALVVVYVVCSLIELSVSFPSNVVDYRNTLLSSILFVSNMFFFFTLDYFDFAAHSNALLHTWSLSVEEQFYIVLPLLFLIMPKSSDRKLFWFLTAILVVSLVASEWVLRIQPSASFYIMPLRAWELLAGSVLSLGYVPKLKGRWIAEAMTAAGVLIIVASSLMLTATSPFPGLNAIPAVLGTAMVLYANDGPRPLLGRLMSIWPAQFFGKISYSLYLWHWPVIVYATYFLPGHGKVDKVILFAISIALATLSYYFVEQPFRTKKMRALPNRRTLGTSAAGIGLIAVLALVLPPLSDARWPANEAAETALATIEDPRHTEAMRRDTCFLSGTATTLAAECVTLSDTRPNVLVLGDSHAAMLWPGLQQTYPQINFLQANGASCNPLKPSVHPVCRGALVEGPRDVLASGRLDAIIVTARWYSENLGGVRERLTELSDMAETVIHVGPFPEYYMPFPEALARADYANNPALIERYTNKTMGRLDDRLADVTKGTGAVYISAYDLVCPQECIRRTPDGTPLMFDNDHLTVEGSLLFANMIAEQIPLPSAD
ncbi:acyltransferase family protein [Parvularcula sp. LCG005]|uniref:acyltransferase family protein n=1 Tax=Parvularcula sp. LCG005 TaxID=3078805 RepID=UPI002941F216|nr:acyltransferase family protein [Parvularcula sp. LCG005]WOI54071.1 acyltransferase family protein [Parvularcula sp. LCG005]